MSEKQSINIWLVGDVIPSLNRTNLPLGLDVLKLCFYHQKIDRETVEDSSKKCTEELINIWSQTGISTSKMR